MSCCQPAPSHGEPRTRPEGQVPARGAAQTVAIGVGPGNAPDGMPRHGIEQVRVPAGSYLMGDHFAEGYPADGETPVHRVAVAEFGMDAEVVTNLEFARFAEQTGHVTEAERFGSSAVFHLQLGDEATWPAGSRRLAGLQWWVNVPGASWREPLGAGSSAQDDHPVVHVSWNDALAYCAWAGRALPTEAQWEYAARGGLEGARYPWGNELTPGNRHQCNIFQGSFPHLNTEEDGYGATAPARSFEPNGYGLWQMSGNVWEWCADWFLPRYYKRSPERDPQGPPFGEGRVMRGGSFLCHESYCNRYRVAARSRNSPDSSSSHCGFRTVSGPPEREAAE